jgi:hypothetical protein
VLALFRQISSGVMKSSNIIVKLAKIVTGIKINMPNKGNFINTSLIPKSRKSVVQASGPTAYFKSLTSNPRLSNS